jgi:undecaprenyl-diphosphatase
MNTGAGPRRVVVRWRPADAVRIVIGAVLVTVCSLAASGSSVSAIERGLFHAVNGLPSWLYRPVWLVMQLGSLAAVFVVAGVAVVLGRFRLALELLAAGLLAYLAALELKGLVARARPTELVHDVVIHGSRAQGLGFPSGHAAVSFALTMAAVPFLSGQWRKVVWLLPMTVGFARIYVGAHFPLDVAGGFAVGYTVGALVHLIGGAPRRADAAKPHGAGTGPKPIDLADGGVSAPPP